MPVTINIQAYTFLYSILCGMLIGLIYDIFRIKRKTIRTRALFIYIEDLIYWIIVVIVVFALIFYSNDGEIRGYILIGVLIGVTLYMLLLSNIIVKLSVKLLDLIGKIIKLILFVITYPFRIVLKLLSIPAKLVSKPVKKLLKSIKAYSRIRVTKITLWKKSLKNMIKKI